MVLQLNDEKTAYTFTTNQHCKLCPTCDNFDSTKYSELPNCLGSCVIKKPLLRKQITPLYRFRTACIDYLALIPDITKELKE